MSPTDVVHDTDGKHKELQRKSENNNDRHEPNQSQSQ